MTRDFKMFLRSQWLVGNCGVTGYLTEIFSFSRKLSRVVIFLSRFIAKKLIEASGSKISSSESSIVLNFR